METADNNYKVKLSHKTAVFIASVVSLSWFFEGWRDIHKEGNLFISWGILIGGTALTVILLGVWGYWIYFEEKAKGTLKKRIGLYENIRTDLQEKRSARALESKNIHTHKGSCCQEQGEKGHCG